MSIPPFNEYDRSLRWTRLLPASRETVWKRWTTSEGLSSFFGLQHRIDAHVGGRFEILFLLDQPEGSQGSEGCTILVFEPLQRLVFTWNAPPHLAACRGQHTVVAVRLKEGANGDCLFELEHVGFGLGPEWDATFDYFFQAWPRVLDRLETSLAPNA